MNSEFASIRNRPFAGRNIDRLSNPRRARVAGALDMTQVIGATIIGLLVLAIGAGLIASGLGSARVSNGLQEMQTLVSNLRSTFNGRYAGITTAVLDSTSVVPPSMRVAAGVYSNTWGGAVTVAPGATTTTFSVTSTGIPTDACSKLSDKFGGDASTGVISLSINGTAQTLPASTAAASAACTAAGSGPTGGNSLVWVFS
jgi:hypothetical protein